jgi:hypothetical protein
MLFRFSGFSYWIRTSDSGSFHTHIEGVGDAFTRPDDVLRLPPNPQVPNRHATRHQLITIITIITIITRVMMIR